MLMLVYVKGKLVSDSLPIHHLHRVVCITDKIHHENWTTFTSIRGLNDWVVLVVAEKRKKCKGKGVFASLFGVGAPEALVIGVVALLVFGPKGLAEVSVYPKNFIL